MFTPANQTKVSVNPAIEITNASKTSKKVEAANIHDDRQQK
jgi:hypothetical protein